VPRIHIRPNAKQAEYNIDNTKSRQIDKIVTTFGACNPMPTWNLWHELDQLQEQQPSFRKLAPELDLP
jgi:hypothetical protein